MSYYFVAPRFEVVSAIYNQGKVAVKIKVVAINDFSVEVAPFDLSVTIHKAQ